MAINAIFYENSIPKGTGFLEITSKEGPSGLFIPLHATGISGTFHGPVGSLTLTQTFRFPRAALDRPIEAIYRFPLPGDAAVTGVVATFGDERIQTRLTGRSEAEKVYDEAFRRGNQSVLVTRESPDVFTLHLTGIPPDTDVVVQTSCTVLARAVPGGWEARLPVTIGPRYVRRDESHAGVQANPLLSVIDPRYRVSLDLTLQPTAELFSVPEGAVVTQAGDETRIRIGSTRPDHDLVFRWAHDTPDEWLTSWAADDAEGAYTYLLSLITPPRDELGKRIPREVILVADQSGSMQGGKWQAAAQSVVAFLKGLSADEVFNLCLFSDQAVWFSPKGPVPATKDAVKAAERFVQATSLFGGTELGVALEQALRQPRQPGEYSRHVLVITDGQVTDEARLFQLVGSEAAAPLSRRVSVISIDTAPNAHLALELARIGGGVAKFLTSSEEVDSALQELLASWQPPILSNAVLTVDRQGIEVNDYRVLSKSGKEMVDVGDLRPETPVFLCSRIPCSSNAPVLTLGMAEEEPMAVASARPGDGDLAGSLKVIFGAGRLRTLEYLMNAGYPDEELVRHLEAAGYATLSPENPLYPENRRQAIHDALERLLVSESLRFGIPSTLTAFVGISDKAGTVPPVTVAVPNALPAGWGIHEMCVDLCMDHMDMIMQSDVQMSLKRSPRVAESLIVTPKDIDIPALEVKNGTAVLVDSCPIAKGSYTLFLTFATRLRPAGVSVRIEIDGKVIKTWSDAKLRPGESKIMIPVHVSRSGRMRILITDPQEAWQGLKLSVSIRKEEGVMWV